MITYAIDAWSANQEKKSGVETYAFQLIQAMKQHALHPNERVVLYSPVKLQGVLAELPTGWEEKTLFWSLPFAWMRGRVSWELFRRSPDVLFVPAQGLPLIPPAFMRGGRKLRVVTTIHDIGYLRLPDLYEVKSRKRISSATKRSLSKADYILTVSEFSKKEIVIFYRISEEKISVTPLAVDQSVYKTLPLESIKTVLSRYRLSPNYFLYVGRLDKKKNVELAIRAFEQFKTGRGVGDPFELILVGEPGFGADFLKKLIALSEQKMHIRVLGHLPDADVSACMNGATAFLFPSWYEGFGIPNLEAIACGTPVLASDIPAHREILHDAAVFLPPNNPSAWANAMRQILEDKLLKSTLAENGGVVTSLYSWEKTAAKTWEILRGLV